MDSVSAALGAISVTTELVVEELEPHIDTLLTAAIQRESGIAEQVVESGILPVLAQALRKNSTLTIHTARLVAELSRDTQYFLILCCYSQLPSETAASQLELYLLFLTLLFSENQELLLHVSRAIGSLCQDSNLQQDRLLRLGAVPKLVSVLLQFCENEALLSSCLLALCNLVDMGEDDGSTFVWEKRSYFDEGLHVFHGTLQHSCDIVSTGTVVQLKQWSQGQYSVSVEMVQKCSTRLWKEHSGQLIDGHLLNFTHLGSSPKFYNVIKYSVRNIPKNVSRLKTAVFHTFL